VFVYRFQCFFHFLLSSHINNLWMKWLFVLIDVARFQIILVLFLFFIYHTINHILRLLIYFWIERTLSIHLFIYLIHYALNILLIHFLILMVSFKNWRRFLILFFFKGKIWLLFRPTLSQYFKSFLTFAHLRLKRRLILFRICFKLSLSLFLF